MRDVDGIRRKIRLSNQEKATMKLDLQVKEKKRKMPTLESLRQFMPGLFVSELLTAANSY